MINNIKRILSINVLILIFFVLLFLKNTYAFESKILIRIDNKIITNVDIINEVKYLKALNPKLNELDKNKIFEIAKTSLIREKIKEIELTKYNVQSVNEEYLESVIKSIYSNIGIKNKNEFLKYIKNFNINISTIEKKLLNEALWNQLIFVKFSSKLKIDKEKIREKLQSTKQISNSYLIYEIVYNIEDNQKPNEIYQKIKNSIKKVGFQNTASIFSISDSSKTGGQIGWVNESSMSKKIFNEMKNLKINEFTKPILIPGGFLILFIKDKKEIKEEIDIEKEIKLKIRSLQNQQLNQYSNIYFNKIKKDIIIYEK